MTTQQNPRNDYTAEPMELHSRTHGMTTQQNCIYINYRAGVSVVCVWGVSVVCVWGGVPVVCVWGGVSSVCVWGGGGGIL